jgi:hypothetical protein
VRGLALIALAALSGCATCQEHPYVCTAVGAVVVTSVALAAAHHYDGGHSDGQVKVPPLLHTGPFVN